MRRIVLTAALLAATLALAPATTRAEDPDLAPKLRGALVRINVTSQSYETSAPWKLGRAYNRSGRGVVVGDGQILCKSDVVANQRMIEIELANSARKYPAKLLHVDRNVGLALIGYDDAHLAKSLAPLPLGEPVKLDDTFDIHQLGNDNIPERYDARVIRASAGSSGLRLTLKTSCSDRGDGQVALKDGKIVGLLVSTYGSRQQGTILSIENIRQYLDDYNAEGPYRGKPGPGIWTQQLLREDLRTYHGLAENQHGIAVSRTVPGRSGHGVLEDGDVILAIDGFDVDDEGKFVHDMHGRLNASYLLGGRRLAGDVVKMKILRDGVETEVDVELKGQKPDEKRVPEGWGAERPQFMVVGGLVLLELTSSSSISRSPGGVLLRRFRERANWDPPGKRKRVIYVDRILKDKATKGFESVYHRPIKTINGIEILDFQSVPKALETPEGAYHVFRFDGLETDIVIPADELETINKRIADKYKVTRMRFLRGDEE